MGHAWGTNLTKNTREDALMGTYLFLGLEYTVEGKGLLPRYL